LSASYPCTGELVQRNLYKGTCTEELVQRNLYKGTCTEELDEKSNSSTGCSGSLGKLMTVDSMGREYRIKVINLGPEQIELPEDLLKDLSTDQNLLYQSAKAVHSGQPPRDITVR
jgi:hypothetical protein